MACNVAGPGGGKTNELSNLLKRWFGENAGLPGTDFKVLFKRQGSQWSVQPVLGGID
jgi:hypothetical protein